MVITCVKAVVFLPMSVGESVGWMEDGSQPGIDPS